MDSSPPYSSSRRRITRNPAPDESVSTASSLQAGPSRLPDFTQLVDVHFSEIGKNIGDTESDDHSTPRLPSSSKLPLSNGETPAARLRALLSLVPNHSTPTPVPPPPPIPESTTEYESDFDRGESINATASIARESLRDVFSRALRAPGGTPQKHKKRRNSIDPSDLEYSPKVEKERSKNKSKRKSLSDEEVENSYRSVVQFQPSFKTRGQPLTMEVLQQRYMNSKSNRHDDALSPSDKQDTSDETADLLRELNSSRTSPPAATSTPQHSLRMSVESQDQLQTNLLDHDSEMQRIIEGLDSFEHPAQSNLSAGISFPHHSETTAFQTPSTPKDDHTAPQPVSNSSRKAASPRASESQPPRERLWSFPKASQSFMPKPRSNTEPSLMGKSPLTSRSLAALSRATSSPRLSEGSSRSGSVISNADHRERTQDLDRDTLQQRERQWGKPTPKLHRRTSNTSLNSPGSGERPRTHSTSSSTDSLGSRSNSPSTSRILRRHSSQNSERSASPTGSAHASQEDILVPKIVLERKRNWNSPRPVWHDYSPRRPESPALNANGNPPKPFFRSRTRTTSLSSIDDLSDDSCNPTFTGSPSFGSRVRHHSSAGPSRPSRSHASSPSIHGRSSIHAPSPPSSPSIQRQGSTTKLRTPADDQKTVRLDKPSSLMARPPSSPLFNSKLFSPNPSNGPDSPTKLARNKKSTLSTHASNSSRTSMHAPRAHTGIGGSTIESSSGPEHPLTEPSSEGQDDIQSQELTPTLRTVAPPPSDSPERPYASANHHDDVDERLTDIESNRPASVLSENPVPEMFGTTPKQPSSSSLRLQFASPSSPQSLPPLPEPPSTEDESHSSSGSNNTSQLARLFDTASALKTPKAPGAWMDTPAPVRRPRAYSDTSLRKDTSEGEAAHPTPGASNVSAMPTPRPPGSWLATPRPSKARYVDQSVETDTEPDTEPEPEADGGHNPLATPITSLSKAYRTLQTPAAPGAWVQTPATRKSVMKVRFDPEANETREFRNGESDASASDVLNASVNSQTQTVSPPATPELVGLALSSPKKTPSIRILDAYGNEQREGRSQSSRKHPSHRSIRLVNALGESIEEDSFQESDSSRSLGSIPPGNRDELLSRVRRGLSELVQEIHEMDCATSMSSSELSRVKELDSVSLNARDKRRRLSSELKKNNDEFKDRFSSLRASMQKNPLSDSSNISRFSLRPSRLVILFAFQVILAVVLYRLSTSGAKELFLTIYYDPFYPDLHLSMFKSQLVLSTSPERFVSWLTLHDLFREHGFKAFAAQARDNFLITISNLQTFAWERWGSDAASQDLAWPPT